MNAHSKKFGYQDSNKKRAKDSQTGVNPNRTHGLGIWGNPRVVMGVRVDKELKNRFTVIAKAKFSSTCSPIEAFMATIVACSEIGVNFGTTVEVGTIVIERNLRERRKLEVEHEVTEKVLIGCGFVGCKNQAVGKAIWLKCNQEYWLCSAHLRSAKMNPRLWKLIQ